MGQKDTIISESIIRDMSEGVMTLGLDGRITSVNPAAAVILERSEEELLDRPFAAEFFEYVENDAFNQAVLDAVYAASSHSDTFVPYYTGTCMRQLHVKTSCLRKGDRVSGVIIVLNDVTELLELRDAVKAMEKIRALNSRLELRNQLLSETFGRFISDEVVKQLLDTPDGLLLGGKKRTLTVMMSDLRGFTALSERMQPGDLVTMLNHYLGEMTEIIQKRNGTIIEFIGDGIMALFGAPLYSDTHAEEAVAAAVEMQAAMEAVNLWNVEHGYPKLEMGIGINTGEVIVGNIGSEKRMKYGVVGEVVNLCGRIEGFTVGGQILISPQTRETVNAELEIRQEQSVFPKGAKAPITISWVVGIGAPYDVTCCREEEALELLSKPVQVPFSIIREKYCEMISHTGTITALSGDGALLRTDTELKQFDNIQMDIGEELFGKVIARERDGWRVRFTSLPPGFKKWKSSVSVQ